MTDLAISYTDVVAAADRITGIANRTPVMTSTTADAQSGARLFFKCENFQRTGAFKIRGAANAIAQLPADRRAAGVVAFSSGNHAQAIALAARLQGVASVIVMPQDAPESKIAATRAYGGEVVLYDRYAGPADPVANRLVEERGATLLPPFDHPHIMAGQGTAVKELIEEVGPLDVILIPTSGGGLLSGAAVTAQALSPGCRVIGVEPEAGNDAQQSLRSGRIVRIDAPRTIADGAQSRSVGQLTFPVMQRLVSDIVTATDAELVETMGFFARTMKILVEPTGCLGAAIALGRKIDLAGQRVGVVLTGGNVDLSRFATLVHAAA